MKHLGLKAPVIKGIFKDIWASDIKSLELSDKLKLSMQCYSSEFMEYKNVGCDILVKIHKELDQDFLNQQAINILRDNCNTWATCDALSSKVIRHMIDKDKTNKYALIVKEWKDSDNIWIQRSSCVSFVCLARHGKYNDTIIEICSQCIKNDERFVQLGVGWVLRELSLADLELVVTFIQDNYHLFSREGLRYAIEKMDNTLKQKLLKYDNSSKSIKKTRKRKMPEADINDSNIKKKRRRK